MPRLLQRMPRIPNDRLRRTRRHDRARRRLARGVIERLEERTLLAGIDGIDRVFVFDPNVVSSINHMIAGDEGFWVAGSAPGAASADGVAFEVDPATSDILRTIKVATEGEDSVNAAALSEGGLFLGGQVAGELDGNPSFGGSDAFVQFIDVETGSVENSWIFGGSGNESVEELMFTDEGIVVAVVSDSTTLAGHDNRGERDIIVFQFDPDLNPLWSAHLATSGDDFGPHLAAGLDGDIGVAFTTAGDHTSPKGGTDLAFSLLGPDGSEKSRSQIGIASDESATDIASDGRQDSSFPA